MKSDQIEFLVPKDAAQCSETYATKNQIFQHFFIKQTFHYKFLGLLQTWFKDANQIKIGAKLNFLSNIFEPENLNKNVGVRFRTLRIFWDQKLNLATFEGGGE